MIPATPIVQQAIAAARAAMQSSGIPASVILAQFALESDWGRDMPPGSNNPFGEKAWPGETGSLTVRTHEEIDGRLVPTQAAFAVFPSMIAAFTFHAQHLATSAHYAAARAKLPDVHGFCTALTGVYATDPAYGAKLIALIDGDRLAQFDAFPVPTGAKPVTDTASVSAPQGNIAVTAPLPTSSAPATKPVMASQTVHGGLVATASGFIVALGQMLPLLGFTDAQDIQLVAAAKAIITIIGCAGAIYGGVQAIIGRFRATTTLT